MDDGTRSHRSRTYTGHTAQEATARFEQDREDAAGSGWVPVHERWEPIPGAYQLTVWYAPAEPRRRANDRLRRIGSWLLFAILLVGSFGFALWVVAGDTEEADRLETSLQDSGWAVTDVRVDSKADQLLAEPELEVFLTGSVDEAVVLCAVLGAGGWPDDYETTVFHGPGRERWDRSQGVHCPPIRAMHGRIERPRDGYAITFPADWRVMDVTDTLHRAVFGEPPGGSQTPLLYALEPDGEAWCEVVDFAEHALSPPAWKTVEDAAQAYAVEGDKVWSVDAAPGRTGRTSGSDDDGWVHQFYAYHAGQRWFYLYCRGSGPGLDVEAIGESFEFAGRS